MIKCQYCKKNIKKNDKYEVREVLCPKTANVIKVFTHKSCEKIKDNKK